MVQTNVLQIFKNYTVVCSQFAFAQTSCCSGILGEILRDGFLPENLPSVQPNLNQMVVVRDRAHGCRRIAKRGWSADEYLGMVVLNMVIHRKTFISEFVWRNGSGSPSIRCLPMR